MNRCTKCGYEDNEDSLAELQKRQGESEQKLNARKAQIKEEKAGSTFSLQKLLSLHVGEIIGINVLDPSKPSSAVLLDTQSDHFCVGIKSMQHYIPYSQIIRVVAAQDGSVKNPAGAEDFSLVVTIFDLVIYKGAVGLGFSVPL